MSLGERCLPCLVLFFTRPPSPGRCLPLEGERPVLYLAVGGDFIKDLTFGQASPPSPKSAKINSFNYSSLVAVIVFLLERQGFEMWPFCVWVAAFHQLAAAFPSRFSVPQEAESAPHSHTRTDGSVGGESLAPGIYSLSAGPL